MGGSPQEDSTLGILVVDDHTLLREGLARLIEREPDMRVVGQAATGEEALERVAELRPNVVIMDYSMPGMNGAQATRALRERFPGVCIIGLSVEDEGYTAEAMLEAGAYRFVNKADAVDVLIAAIRAAGGDGA